MDNMAELKAGHSGAQLVQSVESFLRSTKVWAKDDA